MSLNINNSLRAASSTKQELALRQLPLILTNTISKRSPGFVLWEIMLALTIFCLVAVALTTAVHQTVDASILLRDESQVRLELQNLLTETAVQKMKPGKSEVQVGDGRVHYEKDNPRSPGQDGGRSGSAQSIRNHRPSVLECLRPEIGRIMRRSLFTDHESSHCSVHFSLVLLPSSGHHEVTRERIFRRPQIGKAVTPDQQRRQGTQFSSGYLLLEVLLALAVLSISVVMIFQIIQTTLKVTSDINFLQTQQRKVDGISELLRLQF